MFSLFQTYLRTFRRDVSLRTTIISVLLVISLSFQVLVSYGFYLHERSEQYEELQEQAEQLCEQISRNLALSLWQMDISQTEQIVSNFSIVPSVHHIFVTDENHKPIISKRNDTPSPSLSTAKARKRPIQLEKYLLGYVEVEMSTADVTLALENYLFNNIFGIFAITVVQVMVLSWMLGKLIVDPIKDIQRYAGDVDSSSPLLPEIPESTFSSDLYNLRSSIVAMVDALVSSEKSYRSIYENALEGLFLSSLSGRFINANPTLSEMFGYSNGKEFIEAVTDIGSDLFRSSETWNHLIKEVLEHGAVTRRETTMFHRNGAPMYCLISIYAVLSESGELKHFSGSLIDISQRKIAENQLALLNRDLENLVQERTAALHQQNIKLAASEERYRNLVERVQEGIITLDQNGLLTFANGRMAEMLGKPLNELPGQSIFSLIKENNRESFLAGLSIPVGESAGRFEVLFHRSDGGFVPTLVSPATFYDKDGRHAGSFVVVTDISALKQLQGQLLEAQKLESIGQLAAGIAHEINTPAQYVSSNIIFLNEAFDDLVHCLAAYHHLFEESLAGGDINSAIAAIEEVRDNLQLDSLLEEISPAFTATQEGLGRITKIVSSVKRFAHPGKDVIAPADLNEAIRNTITLSTNEWKYVAEMEVDLDDALPPVSCNISSINQVILNLLVNAAHAIGEAKVLSPEHRGVIQVSTRSLGSYVEIRIGDNGNGIPENIRERIFDPFFTTKEVGKGSGQGLAIARTIVSDEHRGSIGFQSTANVGTVFTVQLPVIQSSQA